MKDQQQEEAARRGYVAAIGAYLSWGLVPAFWKQLLGVPALELVAHRVAWSFLLVTGMLVAKGSLGPALAVLRDRRRLAWMFASTALISVNWLVYVWAVTNARVTEASLGYYLNPLLNVLLGRLVLGERLRRLQLFSVLIASAGVLFLIGSTGTLPWVSLVLAVSFGLYGLVRKQAPVDAMGGLWVETALALPFALIVLVPSAINGTWAISSGTTTQAVLVVTSGAVTALPLVWFATAARSLPLSTIGIVQYLSPTCQLALGVLAYGEPFTRAHAVTFGCIWAGVAIYVVDALLTERRRRLVAL